MTGPQSPPPSYRATQKCMPPAAGRQAGRPYLLTVFKAASVLACAASRTWTTSLWPFSAAMYRHVAPVCTGWGVPGFGVLGSGARHGHGRTHLNERVHVVMWGYVNSKY